MTWVQPVLTANGTIGQSEFAVASGGGAESDAYKAFDSSASSYVNKMNSGAWLSFYSKTWLVISDILITSNQSLPSQGIFQVSYDDGATWEQIGSWQDEEETGNSAHIVFSEGVATGNYFRFVSQGRSLAKPNNNADFCNVAITADEATTGTRVFSFDVERVIKNDAYIQRIAQSLKVWLPFDSSATADKCGNAWTAYGTTSVSDNALQVNKGYLRSNETITFGGADFTVSFYAYVDSSSENWATPFAAAATLAFDGRTGQITLRRVQTGNDFSTEIYNSSNSSLGSVTVNNLVGAVHHFEYDYTHADSKFRIFIDGVLSATQSCSLERLARYIFIGTNNCRPGNQRMVGTIDELMIFDGVALHTADFTPPTADDYLRLALEMDGYAPISLDFDVERKVANSVEVLVDVERKIKTKWRYVNAGTADDLLTSGNTLTNLPESKSKTGTAFYQTARQKCFDIPATDEIWIKFDVYFDGSKRWRAYDVGTNGTCGITAQTDGQLGFFVNDIDQGHFNDVCKKNQLQTVLLHMVSGSSNGIVEAWVDGTKIYRYTGDVNHGQDFADIYLQSDGAGTFFSNVIISNAEIELGEGWQIFTFDVERQLSRTVEIEFDVERVVKNVVPIDLVFDVELQDILPVTIAADVERRVIVPVDFTADIELLAVMRVDFTADVSRNIKTNFIAYATDNSQYLSGGNTPVVIPSQTVIPPVNDSDANMQSIEISIAEQQITDQVKLVGIVPFDIMFPVQGQYLDYYCDMRVERVQRQGVLYSADCCSDIDELLYTQINYSVPDDQHIIFKADLNSGIMQQYSGEVSEEDTVIYKAYAGNHLNRIAEALGKSCVCQFDDFVSNMEVNQENVTYADLISQLFGWSSRVPNRMINCFLHGDTLFAIQRGQEANVIDISGTDKTLPTYTREIVRTTWGSSANTNDTTKYQTGTAKKTIYHAGHKIYFPPPSRSPDGKTSYSYTSVSPRGWCLASTETRNDDGSRVIVDYHYGTGHYGEMVLTSETRISYDAEGNKVDESKTVHHNLSPSQQYSRVDDEDGSDMGSSVGSNLPGFYCEWGWVSLPEEIVQEKAFVILASEYDTWVKYYEDKGIEVDWSSVYQIPSSIDTSDFLKEYSFANSAFADTEKQMKSYSDFFSKVTSGTTSGTSLVDTAFPVTDSETLLLLILALKWLNRRTKETVTLSIYNFPHVIDFNDRVVLFGETYFLVSNRALSNNRRFNEQNLTLVRWF